MNTLQTTGPQPPARFQPGIGLRPGGEKPGLEPLVVTLYLAMYDSIAAHSRRGVNVVVDVGHHDSYSVPRGILAACARVLQGLPVLFVGVRCSVETVRERRRATWGRVESRGPLGDPVKLWHDAVHTPGCYDLDVDTAAHSPEECADFVAHRLEHGPPSAALFRQPT